MYTCVRVSLYSCINVFMYTYIRVYMYSLFHHFANVFRPDFLDLTMFLLICFNALFHDVFHESPDGKSFFVRNGLHLVDEFF